MRTRSLSLRGSAAIAFASVMIVLAPVVMGQAYTITVKTDTSSYIASQAIHFTGTVSPAPGSANSPSAVYLQVMNPNSIAVIKGAPSVNGTTGDYSFDAVAGGTTQWIAGTYKVSVTWGASGEVISAVTTFSYAPQVITTSSSSSTTHASTTTSTSSSTSVSVTSTSSSTPPSTTTTFAGTSQSSSSGGGGIPEFPLSLFLTAIFAVALVGAYLIVKRLSLPSGRTTPTLS